VCPSKKNERYPPPKAKFSKTPFKKEKGVLENLKSPLEKENSL